MVKVAAVVADEYQAAWEAWQSQLKALHHVFLEGVSMEAPRLKGLLNREARAKDRYDSARLQLLGILTELPVDSTGPREC